MILFFCRKNLLTWLMLFSTIFALLQIWFSHLPSFTVASTSLLGVLTGFLSAIPVSPCLRLLPWLLPCAPPPSHGPTAAGVPSRGAGEPPVCRHAGTVWSAVWACLLRPQQHQLGAGQDLVSDSGSNLLSPSTFELIELPLTFCVTFDPLSHL